MLFHHKDGEQMARQFVVFTFEVKLIERRSLYVKCGACEVGKQPFAFYPRSADGGLWRDGGHGGSASRCWKASAEQHMC